MTELLQTLFSGLVVGTVYSLIAIGFTVCYESTGVLNFAQGDLVALGAYLIFEAIAAGWPTPLAIVMGIVVIALLMAIFERVVLRRLFARGMLYAVIATIGLSGIIESAIQQIWGPIPIGVKPMFSSNTFLVGSVHVSPENLFAISLSVSLASLLAWAIERTRFGRALQTIARDRTVAALLGIPEGLMGYAGFGISGGLAAIAGLLLGPVVGLTPTMGLSLGVTGFTAATLGGLGSVTGALVGGIALGWGESLIGTYISPSYSGAFAYASLVLVLLVRPQGLLGELSAAARSV